MALPLGPPLPFSWEYKILEGGLGLSACEGAAVRDHAAEWMRFILVAYFMGDLGQVHLSELRFFVHVKGIWRPPRIADVKD